MMKKGQLSFGMLHIIKTFGNKQGVIYSTTKSNKLSNALVLIGDADNFVYYNDLRGSLFFSKDFVINESLTMFPNGKITVAKK